MVLRCLELGGWSRSWVLGAVCPAEPTGRGGSHGGTWVLVQRSLESHDFLPGVEGSQLIGDQWTAAAVRMKGFDVVLVAVYLEDGIGLAGANIDRLGSLSKFLEQLSVPYIIMGDWNLEPGELEMARWPESVRGRVVQPSGVAFTCRSGKGRMLDYAVVFDRISAHFTLEADMESPWAPRQGLVGKLASEFKQCLTRKQVVPSPVIESLGPDRPWSEFWDKACSREGQGQLGGIDIPMDEIACSGPLAQRFARFSFAFELMLRSRATEGEGDRRALGRGPQSFGQGAAAATRVQGRPSAAPQPPEQIY